MGDAHGTLPIFFLMRKWDCACLVYLWSEAQHPLSIAHGGILQRRWLADVQLQNSALACRGQVLE